MDKTQDPAHRYNGADGHGVSFVDGHLFGCIRYVRDVTVLRKFNLFELAASAASELLCFVEKTA
jgi:hypothetical protein